MGNWGYMNVKEVRSYKQERGTENDALSKKIVCIDADCGSCFACVDGL